MLKWQQKMPGNCANISVGHHPKALLTNSSIISLDGRSSLQQKHKASRKCNWEFFIAPLKSFTGEINFNIFYLTQHIQNITSTHNYFKTETFCFFIKSLKTRVHFIYTAHLNSIKPQFQAFNSDV